MTTTLVSTPADLPRPAIYLPTETDEGATLVTLEGGEADFMAGLVALARYQMFASGTCGPELSPRLVWPAQRGEEGAWLCQATGDELSVDELVHCDTEGELAAFIGDWVAAAIE